MQTTQLGLSMKQLGRDGRAALVWVWPENHDDDRGEIIPPRSPSPAGFPFFRGLNPLRVPSPCHHRDSADIAQPVVLQPLAIMTRCFNVQTRRVRDRTTGGAFSVGRRRHTLAICARQNRLDGSSRHSAGISATLECSHAHQLTIHGLCVGTPPSAVAAALSRDLPRAGKPGFGGESGR